jgi:hypothetical protein
MEQIMECMLAEMKASQEEIMAKTGLEIKTEVKTNQESLEAKIEANSEKCEVLREKNVHQARRDESQP